MFSHFAHLTPHSARPKWIKCWHKPFQSNLHSSHLRSAQHVPLPLRRLRHARRRLWLGRPRRQGPRAVRLGPGVLEGGGVADGRRRLPHLQRVQVVQAPRAHLLKNANRGLRTGKIKIRESKSRERALVVNKLWGGRGKFRGVWDVCRWRRHLSWC